MFTRVVNHVNLRMAVFQVRRGKERTSPTFSSSAVPFQIHRQQPLSNLRIYATDARASESSPIFRRPNMLYPSGQWYTKLGTTSAPLFALSLCGSLYLQGFPVKNCTIALLGRRSHTLRTGVNPRPSRRQFSKQFKGN